VLNGLRSSFLVVIAPAAIIAGLQAHLQEK
jgi:hypothetical protein